MKTSELQGAALDWAVAKCEGYETLMCRGKLETLFTENGWTPSTNWEQGGPIIEREGIALQMHFGHWIALPYDSVFSEEAYQQGPTPLVAAMRCYVAVKLGGEVSIPEELV